MYGKNMIWAGSMFFCLFIREKNLYLNKKKSKKVKNEKKKIYGLFLCFYKFSCFFGFFQKKNSRPKKQQNYGFYSKFHPKSDSGQLITTDNNR